MKYRVAWIILALALILGLGSLDWPRYRRLAARAVPTPGTITALPSDEPVVVHYEYQVGGRLLQGRSSVWPPNPPRDELKVGQPVTVHYDRSDPGLSVLGDPREALFSETVSVAFAAMLLATLAVGWWFLRDQESRDKTLLHQDGLDEREQCLG